MVNKLVYFSIHDIFLGMKGIQRKEKKVLALALCKLTTCKHTPSRKHPKPKKFFYETVAEVISVYNLSFNMI